MKKIITNPMSNLQNLIAEQEKEFAKIVKLRQNSKYHSNYIAIHIVEKLLHSFSLRLLEEVKKMVEESKPVGETIQPIEHSSYNDGKRDFADQLLTKLEVK